MGFKHLHFISQEIQVNLDFDHNNYNECFGLLFKDTVDHKVNELWISLDDAIKIHYWLGEHIAKAYRKSKND